MALVVLLLLAGCGTSESSHGRGAGWLRAGATDDEEEGRQRMKYQTRRDPRAMRWLLAHKVRPGMTHAEVSAAIGDDGEREMADGWLKTKGSSLFVDDVVYRYGPDQAGNSVYLAFREGKLFNFRPQEFSDEAKP